MIEVRDLSARVGGFHLRDIAFAVPAGEYGVVIGPAGSGKTTLLETIAGITPQTGGRLLLDGADATRMPPEERRLGLVYQHGYLFPHLTVRENIAYGAADAAAARGIAARLGADGLERRSVASLSGGERQVVALARALARRPSVLLLDEPFSALDPRRRSTVRREVRALHREWGMTVLQVTHDFTEAGLLGDVAILLDAGRVLQSGPPDRVFREPASVYVAEFLGAENVFAGIAKHLSSAPPDWEARSTEGPGLDPRAASAAAGHHAIEFSTGPLRIYTVGDAPEGQAHAVVRAEEVVIGPHLETSSVRNHFRGRITAVESLGALTRVTLDIDGVPLVAALTTRSARELALAVGGETWASFKAMAVHLC